MTRATLAALAVMLGCRSSAREVVVYTSVDQPFSQPVFASSTGGLNQRGNICPQAANGSII